MSRLAPSHHYTPKPNMTPITSFLRGNTLALHNKTPEIQRSQSSQIGLSLRARGRLKLISSYPAVFIFRRSLINVYV